MRKTIHYLIIIFGFIAPTFELIFRLCSNIFFDPLPSPLHTLSFYLIPIGLVVAKIITAGPFSLRRSQIAAIAIFYAIVFSIAYSIWFLPISFISVLGIIFLSIGLLGLTPFMLLYLSVAVYREWLTWLPNEVKRRFAFKIYYPILLVIPALVFLWWHPIVIKTGESLLQSSNPSTRQTGLWMIDHLSSDRELHRRCFRFNNTFFGHELYDHEILGDAYFYLNGSRPGLKNQNPDFPWGPRWRFDQHRGSTAIGDLQDDLYLTESAIDINARQHDGYAYCEWTMVFKNRSNIQKEARAAIQLPHNSVVSKVSLWVDGEEREAAYGTSSHVKSVYRSIVERRRDPLLVTMIGPSQIQAQCFPVPPQGEMKIRLGITLPFIDEYIMPLPHICESNFHYENNMQHVIWVESDNEFRFNPDSGDFNTRYRSQLNQQELKNPKSYFEFRRLENGGVPYSKDGVTMEKVALAETNTRPVLLIDGNRDIIDKLKGAEIPTEAFVEVIISQPFKYVIWDKNRDLRDLLARQGRFSGTDPLPALIRAIDIALENNAAVIWIHGSLPPAQRNELALEQIIRRSDGRVRIISLSLGENLNSIVTDLAFMQSIITVPVLGNTTEDLKRALKYARMDFDSDAVLSSDAVYLAGRRESGMRLRAPEGAPVNHLYRLYLYSKLMRQYYSEDEIDPELLSKTIETRIVTPLTGAVVLENDQQYKAANLDPSVGETHIPKIPEPEFYIMFGILAIMLAVLILKKKLIWLS